MTLVGSERLRDGLAPRYRLDRELGRGGMATVYLAEDLRHRRPVAIKVVHPTLIADVGAERFLREIEIVARLNHPHILPLHDSGRANGSLYYVMPFVDGESLRDRLDRDHQLPVDEAVRIALELADALSYAHAQGIVHRDVKPANVLLSGGHAVLADFGVAHAVAAAIEQRLTGSGLVVGTPLYMSPEQACGEMPGVRSDLYALGCVLYEMLAGEPPFTGPTREAVLARKSAGALPSLRIVRQTVPEGVEEAIERALARVPADRHATASEFAEALRRARSGLTGTRRQRRSTARRMTRKVTTAFLLVGLLSGGGWWLAANSGAGGVDAIQRANAREVNPAAYEAWLLGSRHAVRMTSADLEECIRYGREAVTIDSAYAPAYALLAGCYNSMTFFTTSHPRETAELSKVAARRAIALDSSHAAAHLSLAWVLAVHDWNWAGADSAFREALRLENRLAIGHGQYGFFLAWLGRADAALHHARKEEELRPDAPGPVTNVAMVLYLARQYDDAVLHARRAVTMAPDYAFAHDRLRFALIGAGEYAEAVTSAESASALAGSRDVRRRAFLGYALGTAGRVDEARVILDELLVLEQQTYVPPTALAAVFLSVGEADHALDWLERGYVGRDGDMVLLKVWPIWDPLRDHHRFQVLLDRMRFPS